jgi:hypothetical protein
MEHMFRSVIVEVGCSFNIIQASKKAMLDTKLSHMFHIPLRPKTLSAVENVYWHSPDIGWTKVNIDGSCFGAPASGLRLVG